MKFLVGKEKRILELGCGTGQLLNILNPSYGLGVDISANMVSIAKQNYPNLEFLQGDLEDESLISSLQGPFDFIILSDTIGYLDDCENTLVGLHSLCTPDTRLIISYYTWVWQPILALGEKIGLKMPSVEMNWLSTEDTMSFLQLADFESVKREWRQLVPRSLFGLGSLINRFIGTLPLIRHLSLRNYLVARPVRDIKLREASTTVLIPFRNEKGNIENAVKRLPNFCEDLEILYVEGNSQDGTLDEESLNLHRNLGVSLLHFQYSPSRYGTG
jgi:SAM-dependent methyltransferase